MKPLPKENPPQELTMFHPVHGYLIVPLGEYDRAKAEGWKWAFNVPAAHHRAALAADEKMRAARDLANGEAAKKAAADAEVQRLADEAMEKQKAAAVEAEIRKRVDAEVARRLAADKNGDGKVSKPEGAAAGVAPGPVVQPATGRPQ